MKEYFRNRCFLYLNFVLILILGTSPDLPASGHGLVPLLPVPVLLRAQQSRAIQPELRAAVPDNEPHHVLVAHFLHGQLTLPLLHRGRLGGEGGFEHQVLQRLPD